jgi:deazaflavin-dependent oxidoreductase (nitroreductase family)
VVDPALFPGLQHVASLRTKESLLRSILAIIVTTMAALAAATLVWRRDPRIGSAFVNTAVNPWLLERGLAGGAHAEIGPLEHIGRKSGIRRLTPVHPEPTPEGFRVMVPLGSHSEWARNVVAAGSCRLQLHERTYELADPRLIPAGEVADLPRVIRAVMRALGFEYLTLRTVSVEPGAL